MLQRLLIASVCALAGVQSARADCTLPATDAERAQCIGSDLRRSDTVINDEYAHLRSLLDAQGQAELKHQEIAWIKQRAATCHVDLREPDRERWFADLLRDYSKTVCVVRFTDRRVAELQAQTAALQRQQAPAGQAAAPASLPALAQQGASGADVYDVVARNQPATGKWYFEVRLDESAIAQAGSATIFVGVHGADFGNVGTLQAIRKRDIGQPPSTIGLAVDLVAGKLYVRFNGAWRETPGSAGGLDVKLGRPYQAKLSSSIPLGQLLDGGQVDVDFGQHPFAYAIPDGYLPLDTQGPERVSEQ